MQVQFEYKSSKLSLINENKSNSSNGAARHLPKAHAGLRKLRPHLRAAVSVSRTDEVLLDVGQPHIIGPAVSIGLDMVAAAVIAAIDQHIADARCADLAEGDFLRVGRRCGLASPASPLVLACYPPGDLIQINR